MSHRHPSIASSKAFDQQNKPKITTLFCDVGGVLLTNGWDHGSRKLAASTFGYDADEFERRHQMVFPPYECGKLTLEEYLHYALFHQRLSFNMQSFIDFMFAQSRPFEEMLALMAKLKDQHQLKIILVSNEGRELMLHRLAHFPLFSFADICMASCFIGLRKPDPAVYRLALDLAQAAPEQSLYIDDRPLLVEVAEEFGMHGIIHQDAARTKKILDSVL